MLQGYGGYGQLGLGSTVNRYAPTQVGAASDWVYLSASYIFTCGIRSNGSTFCWGYNNAGQLGDGTVTQRTDPVEVLSSTTFSQITTSPYGSCGIPGPAPTLTPVAAAPPVAPFPKGPACWGSNAKGQWGDGTVVGTSSYPGSQATSVWSRLSMSDASTCGIMAGTLSLYCWGADPGYGNLGLNATVTQNYPTIVAGGGQWKAVFANDYHVGGGRVCLLLGLSAATDSQGHAHGSDCGTPALPCRAAASKWTDRCCAGVRLHAASGAASRDAPAGSLLGWRSRPPLMLLYPLIL